ncbi:hypothetical protein JOM56_011284 [Amanita muscaria]
MYHCSNAENSNGYGTWKRDRDDEEADNGLIFLLGPGGRAAVITKQIPEPELQGSVSQNSPSTFLVPLSSSGEVSATVAEASDTPLSTTTQALPSASTPETSLGLVSASTTEAPSSGVATESSLQTAIPSTISSEAVNGKPPPYAGIVLGTIAGIACLAALLTWWIRIRSHAKRRRLYGDTDIPWAPSESIDGGLEEAREVTQTRSREDLVPAELEAWQPRGDCGIGEPRRFECQQKDLITSSKGPLTPIYNNPYAHRVGAANPDDDLAFVQPCRNGPYPNARLLPSYLRTVNSSSSGSVDDHSTASSLGPLRVANLLPGDRSAATSRAGTVLGMDSQAYSLGSEDIEDLINTESCSTLDQRTNSTLSWANTTAVLKETDAVSEKQETPSTTAAQEGWATSLKTIFAVMASNLSTRSASVKRKDDRFTPIPRKRSAAGFSSESDAQRDIASVPYRPQMSLEGRRGTKSRQLRRELLSRSRDGLRGMLDSTPSRASSIYSTASANYQSDQFGEMPTNASQDFADINSSSSVTSDTRNRETSWSRPAALTRVSSTGCSISTQLTENEEAAQRALIDRRRRAKRSDEGEARCLESWSG